MQIAFLKSTFHATGGLEKYCLRLAKAFRLAGHTVTIVTSSENVSEALQICRKIRPSFAQLLWFDWNCRRWLKKHPQNCVFGFDRHFLPLDAYRAGNGCHAAYLERRKEGASFLKRLSFFCNPLHILTCLSEKYTFEKYPPKAIICNSHLVEEELCRWYPKIPQDCLHVVHNGVEWEEYAIPFLQREKRERTVRLLFIGHEWKRKGLEILLKAISLIKDKGFRLVVVGRERNPDHFIRLAKTLGLSSIVEFHSTSKKAISFYQAADIALLPSLYDPFANTTVEALAMGLYVITTPSNGGSEVIVEGVNGRVVEPIPEKIAEAIVEGAQRVQEPQISESIRETVRKLDFANQLTKIVSLCDFE